MLSATTASFSTVLESVGYEARSDKVAAVDPYEMTGFDSIDAASASGPVTAERSDPMKACRPYLLHSTARSTAT
eukprot:760742-Rhodomonas_salina.1